MIDTYRAKGIPLDSYGIDYDWKNYGSDNYGEFTWNTNNFPDAASSALKNKMESEGVKLIGPVKATLIGCLEPASATALSALFLGTRFSLPELSGFCFIILTVFLSVTGAEKQL